MHYIVNASYNEHIELERKAKNDAAPLKSSHDSVAPYKLHDYCY